MSKKGHNEKTEREQYEEQQFVRAYGEIKSLESSMAGTKGDMSALYNRLKDLGFTKSDIKFAKSLQDKNVAEVIADFEKKIRIARMFGHQLGRQVDMFEDRAPAEDRAYEEGLAAGKLRADNRNPHDMSTKAGQAWQKGYNEGNEFANKDLKATLEAAE